MISQEKLIETIQQFFKGLAASSKDQPATENIKDTSVAVMTEDNHPKDKSTAVMTEDNNNQNNNLVVKTDTTQNDSSQTPQDTSHHGKDNANSNAQIQHANEINPLQTANDHAHYQLLAENHHIHKIITDKTVILSDASQVGDGFLIASNTQHDGNDKPSFMLTSAGLKEGNLSDELSSLFSNSNKDFSSPNLSFHSTNNFDHPDGSPFLFGGNAGPNFFVKAASAITGFFVTPEKAHAATLGAVNNDGDLSKLFTGFFTATTVVPSIEHQPLTSQPMAIIDKQVIFEDGQNHFFFITSPALSTVNASESATTITLTAIPNVPFTSSMLNISDGIGERPYIERGVTSTKISALQVGGGTSPGTIAINPTAATAATAVPGQVNLSLNTNDAHMLIAGNTVPANLISKVGLPPDAKLVYSMVNSVAPNILPIVDYSSTSHITSLTVAMNFGVPFHAATDVVLNTSNGLAVVLFDVSRGKGIVYVDSHDIIHGIALRGIMQNPGTVIQEGPYSYTHAADINHDGYDDLLFGGQNTDNALVLYGQDQIPSLINLTQLPASVSATQFILPEHNIVGVPISDSTVPLDGGSALNALPTPTAGVNYVGDFNGDGSPELIVEKHSVNYAYDSDLVYVINGQSTNYPSTVQLLPYGDPRLASGIVGVGVDSNGNVVENIHGITITGPLTNAQGTVAPDSFSVKGIGDMNGDGYGDLLAFSNNNTAYIIFGHPSGVTNAFANVVHLGNPSPYVMELFNLTGVASSTHVPTINDFNSGSLNGDGLNDILLTSAISPNSMQNSTIPLSQYLTIFNNSTGTEIGAILSGAALTDHHLSSILFGSSYGFYNSAGQYDISHIILGLNNQTTLIGHTGIDDIIGGTGDQTLIETAMGTTSSHFPGVVGSTLIGGDGTNVFEIADPVFHEIRGGSGFDTLTLHSGSLDLTRLPDPTAHDLASRADHIVHGIERINLGDDASLVLDPHSVLNLNTNLVSVLGLNSDGETEVGTLLVASNHPSSLDPAHAPTVILYNDAQHQWIAPDNNPNALPQVIDGQMLSSYGLANITAGGALALTGASIFVENNVHVQIHAAA